MRSSKFFSYVVLIVSTISCQNRDVNTDENMWGIDVESFIDSSEVNTINSENNNSAIEIELSIPHSGSIKHLGLHCEESPVYVIIKNNSDSIIHFYQDWNSWGYYNVEFEIKTHDSIYSIKRGERSWFKNFPSYHSINPSQSLVLPFNLSDTSCNKIKGKVIRGQQPGWVGLPQKSYDFAEIKVIYSVDNKLEFNHFYRDNDSLKMWVGKMKSKKQSIVLTKFD